MACCVVGSLLMLLAAGAVRAVKRHLLRVPEQRPETWRLSPD